MSAALQSATLVPITAGSGYFLNQSSPYIHNMTPAKGIKVFINVTSAGSGSITPVILYVDANGIGYPALSGTPISSNGKYVMTIYPTADSNNAGYVVLNDAIPQNLQININANNSNVINYSAAYSLLR